MNAGRKVLTYIVFSIYSLFDFLVSFNTPHNHRTIVVVCCRVVLGDSGTIMLRRRISSSTSNKLWRVYLSGEIHSDWREVIAAGIHSKDLPVQLTSPNTSHEDSDDCGAIILGMEEKRTNWDRVSASMNGVRTKALIKDADIVVVRFGEKYRQWNAAFDAGYAAALGKSIITLHPPNLSHMLKEVNASASVVCEEPEQVVDSLAYVIRGELPTPRDGDEYVPIADRLGAGNPNP